MIRSNLKINKKLSLVDQVEERLLAHFKEMSLKPGDTLPGEIELKEALGVGRSVLREALSRFRMIGLIDSKPGRGMLLREPSLFSGMERVMNPHLFSHEKLMDLLGFRVVLELGAVDFIFDNVKDEDIDDLQRIVDRQVVYDKVKFTPQSDYEFHVRLMQIANNESVKQFQNILYPIFVFIQNNYQLFLQTYEEKHKDRDEITHQDLLVLLSAGDRDNFREAMKQHFDMYYYLIKQQTTNVADS
ncbi:MAG: GntR family transcriptional regulator [Marinifilum sp.]|jgi:DNA-binding FadR family transcriptional regulator|nr:GntR family transcriptional regulator [Marinifilum sp.]MCT4644643.1 GntR family transcriptional regulator [Carboxylicivirga sp.]